MQWWCTLRKDKGGRRKDEEVQKSKKMFVASLASSSSLLAFSFHLPLTFFILHHSSLILFISSFLLGVKRPARFVTWQRNCPIGQTDTASCFFSSFHHLWATGYSHLALPRGESLFGGDSQAQMFVGSDYSSLPSSSRVNRISILMLRIPVRSPKGCTVGRCFGFDPRRDD